MAQSNMTLLNSRGVFRRYIDEYISKSGDVAPVSPVSATQVIPKALAASKALIILIEFPEVLNPKRISPVAPLPLISLE